MVDVTADATAAILESALDSGFDVVMANKRPLSGRREEYERLEFSQEVLDEREAHWAEIFGDHWPVVQSLRAAFTRETGLILLDLSLNNIKFAEA